MIHFGIDPGVHGGCDNFFEMAMVMKVEAYASDNESQRKQQDHDVAGGFVPENEGDETGDRHKTGINDRQPGDRIFANDIDVFNANIDHQADECVGEDKD
jgi:hypothetical protein